MIERIWQIAILADFPSVATAYTGKLVFCLYVVYTSFLNEMCYTGRLLPPPTHIQQHLLWHSVYSRSFDYGSFIVLTVLLDIKDTEMKSCESWVQNGLCAANVCEKSYARVFGDLPPVILVLQELYSHWFGAAFSRWRAQRHFFYCVA